MKTNPIMIALSLLALLVTTITPTVQADTSNLKLGVPLNAGLSSTEILLQSTAPAPRSADSRKPKRERHCMQTVMRGGPHSSTWGNGTAEAQCDPDGRW
jgi:hypothetical protein